MKVASGPLGWVARTRDEFHVLGAYVANVEEQLRDGLIRFVSDFQEDEIDMGAGQTYRRLVYDGLDDGSWDIKDIYSDYFPNLHRRSVLITLFGILEDSLVALCRYYHRRDVSEPPPDRMSIALARKYLVQQASLDLSSPIFQRWWREVTCIRDLRNLVVHHGGRLDRAKPHVRSMVQDHELLNVGDDGVVIGEGYLASVLHAFEMLVAAFGEAMKMREESSS